MPTYNSLQHVSDMKAGHYMKILPRSMFRAQLFAVLWLSIVQTATFNWMIGNLPEVCTPDQPQDFTCNGAKTFYDASVIRGTFPPLISLPRASPSIICTNHSPGVIGPKRVFGRGATYSWSNWFLLIGAALPVIQYGGRRAGRRQRAVPQPICAGRRPQWGGVPGVVGEYRVHRDARRQRTRGPADCDWSWSHFGFDELELKCLMMHE